MTLTELLKKTEESFDKKFGYMNVADGFIDLREQYKSMKENLISSLEEAYTLGEENMRKKAIEIIEGGKWGKFGK